VGRIENYFLKWGSQNKKVWEALC